jgi:hypothetical protein
MTAEPGEAGTQQRRRIGLACHLGPNRGGGGKPVAKLGEIARRPPPAVSRPSAREMSGRAFSEARTRSRRSWSSWNHSTRARRLSISGFLR